MLGCDGDEIESDLKILVRETCPSYEALFYVWGDPSRSLIQCSGTTMYVTKNLKYALLQLRIDGKTRVLWIDAICLNQLDLQEQAQQVKIMSSIYSKAPHTVV
jgi:Heterokaryon incompatibility protein (HET)